MVYVNLGQRSDVREPVLHHNEIEIANDHRRAFLAIVDGNTRARQFYERHGWHDVGTFDYYAWPAPPSW